MFKLFQSLEDIRYKIELINLIIFEESVSARAFLNTILSCPRIHVHKKTNI
jgi:hypothetical protein